VTEPESWQEEWRFHLDEEGTEVKQKIRGYVQFGGRLTAKDYFLPRAQEVCREHNLSLIGVEGFVASVDLNKDQYTVSACVTLKRDPSQ